jgi:hypothetical protein
MGTSGWVAYLVGLAMALAMALVGLALGVWMFAVMALALGLCFALTAPFIFAQRWKAPPPRPTRRPVVRRRR